MKKLYSFLFIIQLLCVKYSTAQNIAINDNGALPDTTAMLDVTSTTKGFLTPRMTAAQRNAIASPAEGLMVYCTTDNSFYYYSNGWNRVGRSNESWNLNGNNGTDPSKHFIGTTDGAAIHFRVANENAGFMNTSHNNSAYGRHSLDSIGNSSVQNTSIGANSLMNAKNSFYNTALGDAAGFSLKWGWNNTFIGQNADAGAPILENATAIGSGATVAQDSSMVLGAPRIKVGFGVSKPISVLCNTDSNITGSDTYGIRRESMTWSMNTQGYVASLHNKSTINGANGLAVKIASTASSATILDLSTGPSNTAPGKTVLIVKGTGNIGIGVTHPSAQMQFDNQQQNRKLVLYDQNNNDHQFYGFGINASLIRYQVAGNTSDHAFFSGASSSTSTELFRIKGNGKIGVAENNPFSKFANTSSNIAGSDAGGLSTESIAWAINNPGYAQGIYNLDSSSNSKGLAIKIAGNSASSTILDLSTGNTINVAGNPVLIARGNGNIGINNASPLQKLDIKGNIAMNDSVILLRQGWDQYHYVKWSPDVDGVKISGYDGGVLSGRNGNILYWRYNNKVGILNANPQQALDVAGTVTIRDSLGIGISSPRGQLQLSNLVQNRKIVLYEDFNNDHQFYGLGMNPSAFRFQIGGVASNYTFCAGTSSTTSNELVRFTGTGYVGIGITNPITKLCNTNTNIMGGDGFGVNTGSVTWDMNMAGYVQGLYNQSAGIGSNGLAVKVAGTTASNIVLDLSAGAQAVTGASIMQVRGNGNVSIGTTASTEKLSVNGAVKITDGGYGSVTNNATTPVPTGGAGTMIYSNNHFFGWNGSAWKQLDN